jgi:hypothetical protein
LVLFLVNNNEFLKLRLLSEMIEYQCLINPDKLKSNNEESNFFVIYMERLVVNRSDYLFNFLYTLNKIFGYLPYLQPLQKRKLLFSAKDVVYFIERNDIPEKFLFDNIFLAPFLYSKLDNSIIGSSIK